MYLTEERRPRWWTPQADKLIATITETNGVHGIAIADDLGKGFISDGRDNDVTVFDLKTNQRTSRVKTGQNPDAIIYEPVTHRVFTFNGRSADSTIIDAKTGNVITASLPVGGKPEFAQVDGKGHVFANIEDKNEIIVIDAKDGVVSKRYSIAPCDGPSGLAIDPKARLYSVCGNKMMIVSDPMAGKVLATPAIGGGTDGVAFDSGYASQRERPRRNDHDGRRDGARKIRARRDHSDASECADDRIRSEGSQTVSADRGIRAGDRKQRRKKRPSAADSG